MSFDFEIKADPTSANKAIDDVQAGLEKVEVQAAKTGTAIDGAFQDKSGRWRSATGQFLTMGQQAQMAGGAAGDAMQKAADGAARAGTEVGGVNSQLGELVALAGTVVSIHAIEDLADEYVTLQNRLRSVSTDQANLNGVMAATFDIAMATRSSWESIASTYARLSNSARGLGLSQQAVLDVTRTLSEATKISGANSYEAMISMSELAHSFATGTLQGREFRVLMRDMPALMSELQKVSGKTTSEFAEMGKHGKITATDLVKYLGDAGPAIAAKFGATLPTIADGFTLIKNAAAQFFGEAGQGSGVMAALSAALRFVAEHFDVFGKAILGVGEALLSLYVIEKVVAMVKALAAAVVANPLGALLIALAVGVSLLRQFSSSINLTTDGSVKLADAFTAIWQMVKEVGSALGSFMSEVLSPLHGMLGQGFDTKGTESSLMKVLDMFVVFGASVATVVRHAKDLVVDMFGGVPVVLAAKFDEAFRGVSDGIVAVINKIIDGINELANIGKTFAAMRHTSERAALDIVRDQAVADEKAITARLAQEQADLRTNQPQVGFSSREAIQAQYNADRKAFYDAQYRAQNASLQIGDLDAAFGPGSKIKPLANIEVDREALAKAPEEFSKKWNADMQVMQDDVLGTVDDFHKKIDAAASARRASEASAAQKTVGAAGGAADPAAATKEQVEADKKLTEALREVTSASNPMVEAQMKLAKAGDIATQAVAAHKISLTQAAQIIRDTAAKTQDAREPYEAWVRTIDAERAALALTASEREKANEVRKAEEELRKKGLVIDAQVHASVVQQVGDLAAARAGAKQATEWQHDLQQAQERLFQPMSDYEHSLKLLDQVYVDGGVSLALYSREVDKVTLAYLDASGAARTFEGGALKGLLEVKDEAMNLGSTVEKALVDAFKGIEDGIVNLVQTGKFSFSSLIDSMLADLTRFAIRALELGLLNLVVGSAVGGGAGAVAGAIIPGVTGPVTSPSQISARGASVGPAYGLGSTAPQSGAASSASARGGGSGAEVHIHNHFDTPTLVAGLRSAEGERVVVNFLRRNPGALRTNR